MKVVIWMLTELPNIGPIVAQQLNAVGIFTKDDLASVGSEEAWLRIQKIDPSACYNRLCALEGAIQGLRWHNLKQEDKLRLKLFYEEHQLR